MSGAVPAWVNEYVDGDFDWREPDPHLVIQASWLVRQQLRQLESRYSDRKEREQMEDLLNARKEWFDALLPQAWDLQRWKERQHWIPGSPRPAIRLPPPPPPPPPPTSFGSNQRQTPAEEAAAERAAKAAAAAAAAAAEEEEEEEEQVMLVVEELTPPPAKRQHREGPSPQPALTDPSCPPPSPGPRQLPPPSFFDVRAAELASDAIAQRREQEGQLPERELLYCRFERDFRPPRGSKGSNIVAVLSSPPLHLASTAKSRHKADLLTSSPENHTIPPEQWDSLPCLDRYLLRSESRGWPQEMFVANLRRKDLVRELPSFAPATSQQSAAPMPSQPPPASVLTAGEGQLLQAPSPPGLMLLSPQPSQPPLTAGEGQLLQAPSPPGLMLLSPQPSQPPLTAGEGQLLQAPSPPGLMLLSPRPPQPLPAAGDQPAAEDQWEQAPSLPASQQPPQPLLADVVPAGQQPVAEGQWEQAPSLPASQQPPQPLLPACKAADRSRRLTNGSSRLWGEFLQPASWGQLIGQPCARAWLAGCYTRLSSDMTPGPARPHNREE
ncbi:hypothetical protein ABPG75_008488 [Micractinium tetrahymenae]